MSIGVSTMEKLKTKNPAIIKNEFPNLEEEFIGFHIHDELLLILEKKKNAINRKMNKEINTYKQVNELSDNSSPAVNNNYVGQKNKSKSRMSSPENNRNINKKLKMNHSQIDESMELLESNAENNLEFVTPTFNLTSPIPKNRRSIGRKMNTDIKDPIYKLPFEHGWKRELVYRTSGDSTVANRANRSGDVYYYSPTNRKLRSLREIQEQLNLSLTDNDPLTIHSFTFLKQAIGINDKSKELIREANTKLPKEDSFVGAIVRPKKSKTPIQQHDHEISDNETNKSSNKMKIVFKNVKKSSKSTSKKDKSNSEAMNNKSSSTPEYITEDWQAIQSSATTSISNSPSQIGDGVTNITNNKRRLSTSDGEVIMQAPCGIRCPNNNEPATLMCAQCLVYYHPACVNLNANLKIVGYICINCRSSVRQRNRRVQSSHTVVVGASESEPLRVEPIRIRQVHQTSDTPNFFIDRTPISKIEEPNYEIDDEHIDENNSVTNTVVCQGNVYETTMIDGSFQEQYVYEMKQTRGPSLMTCVVQVPKNLDDDSEINGSTIEISQSMATMQSFNYMVIAMKHVFKYLKTHELLTASRVCTAWNIIAMNNSLWKNIRLKNSMVYDWEKFIDAINNQCSVAMDTRRMLIPTQISEYESFWLRFAKAMKRAKRLKVIELYRCPTHVVEDAIYSLPQLEVLNAISIKNPTIKDTKNSNEFMPLNLGYLGQMTQLTEIRLKGLSNGIKLLPMPSFEKLTNLKSLSLTSIKSFPKDICRNLETLTTGLEFLEIGDCDCLSKDFAVPLKRLVNLTSLRLENCTGRWDAFATDVFRAIRGLENLKILELINIDFTSAVENELEKCYHIKALMIIPAYVSQSATTNCHLLDCLKKLSKTLTHLVWGITNELLRVTDLFISQYHQNQHVGYNLELSNTSKPSNNIPILRIRKGNLQPNDSVSESENEKKSDNVDILSIPALEKLLDSIFISAKTKVIKIPFAGTTRVYLADQFNEIISNIKNN